MDYYLIYEEWKSIFLQECKISSTNTSYKASKNSIVIYKANRNKQLRNIVNFFTSYLPQNTPVLQRWYYFLHNIGYHKLFLCKTCGKQVRFSTLEIGYKMFCGGKCVAKHSDTTEKRKQTYFDRTGYTNPNQNPDIKNKKQKTCQERYGSDTPFHSSNIQNKIKQTVKEKYGYEYVSQIPSVRQKGRDSFLNNHTTEEIKEIYIKSHSKNLEEYKIIGKKAEETYYKRTGYKTKSANPNCNFGKGGGKITRKRFNNRKDLYYQSQLELDFIKLWLEFYPIDTIKNAPSVKYIYENSEHIYLPDFEITFPNNQKAIVELKANHHFFYNELENRKLLAKWNATEQFIENNPEYIAYYFILNGELVTKAEVFC